MAGSSYMASEIIVGDLANKIGISSDGSMTFTDPYVPTVKLKDIIGGEIVLEPALMVYVDSLEWVAQPVNQYGQIFYKIVISHNWGYSNVDDVENILPIGALVKTFDENNKEVSVESIQCFANTVEIVSSRKMIMKVAVKKIG